MFYTTVSSDAISGLVSITLAFVILMQSVIEYFFHLHQSLTTIDLKPFKKQKYVSIKLALTFSCFYKILCSLQDTVASGLYAKLITSRLLLHM